ncbi:MAG: P-II family nitrogen regulator [Lachnospiraceae bacterium]|nr:P-II family nitrogen regulator [Lachnospiraceae bacterium]
MGCLYLKTTIADRKNIKKYLQLFKENGLHISYLTLGAGTVSNEVLDYLGLDSTEKAVAFSVVEEKTWITVKNQLQKKLKIDAPGGGISFIIPLSSVGGKKTLQFLLEEQEYKKEEESILKNTTHELIVVIAEQGYTELIMDAARGAGAYGGTVIHAKGTGIKEAERFLGVSIAAEKEILFIVSKAEEKNAIMLAIMEKAGLNSKAKSIAFSLPVTDTAGLRLIED